IGQNLRPAGVIRQRSGSDEVLRRDNPPESQFAPGQSRSELSRLASYSSSDRTRCTPFPQPWPSLDCAAMDLDTLDIALRLGVATLVGAVLGLNRDLHGKATGVRTLGLVCL